MHVLQRVRNQLAERTLIAHRDVYAVRPEARSRGDIVAYEGSRRCVDLAPVLCIDHDFTQYFNIVFDPSRRQFTSMLLPLVSK
ncbi:hypothetical protein CUJ88_45890 (plasmid) [Paraburkholderia hospita]|nr:hypothetical protein CUJ88_45890 [Paraburkholderia hospita]